METFSSSSFHPPGLSAVRKSVALGSRCIIICSHYVMTTTTIKSIIDENFIRIEFYGRRFFYFARRRLPRNRFTTIYFIHYNNYYRRISLAIKSGINVYLSRVNKEHSSGETLAITTTRYYSPESSRANSTVSRLRFDKIYEPCRRTTLATGLAVNLY